MSKYIFSMRGEKLMVAEDDGSRKAWDHVCDIFKEEGKGIESGRKRNGWSWRCLATGASNGVYKAKGEAKADAQKHCLALLSGEPSPFMSFADDDADEPAEEPVEVDPALKDGKGFPVNNEQLMEMVREKAIEYALSKQQLGLDDVQRLADAYVAGYMSGV